MFWFSTVEKVNTLIHVINFLVPEIFWSLAFFLKKQNKTKLGSVSRGRVMLRFGSNIIAVTKVNLPKFCSKLNCKFIATTVYICSYFKG